VGAQTAREASLAQCAKSAETAALIARFGRVIHGDAIVERHREQH
jgi:hypothetical protein